MSMNNEQIDSFADKSESVAGVVSKLACNEHILSLAYPRSFLENLELEFARITARLLTKSPASKSNCLARLTLERPENNSEASSGPATARSRDFSNLQTSQIKSNPYYPIFFLKKS